MTAPTAPEQPPTPDPTSAALTVRQDRAEVASLLAGPDPLVETYLEKVGRLNMARLQAAELVPDAPPATEPDREDLDSPTPPDLPADPMHPLRSDAHLMSDQEYRSALERWRTTEEYQAPLRAYQEWLARRRDG